MESEVDEQDSAPETDNSEQDGDDRDDNESSEDADGDNTESCDEQTADTDEESVEEASCGACKCINWCVTFNLGHAARPLVRSQVVPRQYKAPVRGKRVRKRTEVFRFSKF